MVEHAVREGVEGARVLEIGGGVGALQAELVRSGAASGEIVELVSAYEPYAREVARELLIEDRSAFRVADLLEDPAAVERADVVLMNRVVCCSPDGIELAAEAARHARRALVLSYPRDLAAIRSFVHLQNLGLRLVRRAFRVFVHPPREIVAAAETAGLELVERTALGVWEVALLRRVG